MADQFKALDKNGSGTISPAELMNGLKEIKGIDYNEKEIMDMISKIDADGNGEINYSEWMMASMNKQQMLSNERIEQAFKMFDANGDGEIAVEELKGMLEMAKTVDEAMVVRAMKDIDNKHKSAIKF